jgi:hypothetical protein
MQSQLVHPNLHIGNVQNVHTNGVQQSKTVHAVKDAQFVQEKKANKKECALSMSAALQP